MNTEPQTRAHKVNSTTATLRWLNRLPVQIALIIALGLGLYLHTLHAPFILDDTYCITDNPAIRDFGYLLDFSRVRGLQIWEDIKNSLMLRSVVYWTFALNYRFGGPSEFGFHLVNTAIHLLNAVLVYFLAKVTLKQARLSWQTTQARDLAGFIPWLVALLFVAHPLQTQAVTYITQRFTTLLTFFYLGGLLLYIVARTAKERTLRWGCYGLTLVVVLLAMKTHESAVTLPAMLLFYDLLFIDGPVRRKLLCATPFLLTMAIIPATVFWLAGSGGDDQLVRMGKSVNLVNFIGISPWDYFITQFGAIVTYLRMLLFPIGQNLIPRYPLADSFFEPRVLGSFLLLLMLFTGASWVVISRVKRPLSAGLLIAFGILWFFITISVSSSLIPLDANLLEYRVYLPSFGIFFGVAVVLVQAVDRGWLPCKIVVGSALVALCLFSAATAARNNLYNDKVVLMQDVLAKNPEAMTARFVLAGTLVNQKRFAEAIGELTEILKVMPDDVNMLVNLGYALSATGRREEAIGELRRAVQLNPEHPVAHGHLGYVYWKQGWIDLAERELHTALTLNPEHHHARHTLATLYEEQGRLADALDQYRVLSFAYPDDRSLIEKVRSLEIGGRTQ